MVYYEIRGYFQSGILPSRVEHRHRLNNRQHIKWISNMKINDEWDLQTRLKYMSLDISIMQLIFEMKMKIFRIGRFIHHDKDETYFGQEKSRDQSCFGCKLIWRNNHVIFRHSRSNIEKCVHTAEHAMYQY